MTRVIIAEKPSVARDIAEVLGVSGRDEGFIGKGETRITWAFGHLVEYVYPEGYEGWEGRWHEVPLPMVPRTWKLQPRKDAGKQLGVIKRLVKDADEVVCATDAGREGEHIFRLIVEFLGIRKPIKRLWISSLTGEAIREGFRKLHDGGDFEPLAASARARAQADWLVGMNMTRAYTVAQGVKCTVGRVQTPTLGMVVRRDRDIESFVRQTYMEVGAVLDAGFRALYVFADEVDGKERWESRLSRAEADEVLEKAGGRPAVVEVVEKAEKKTPPPQLFDLTTLQREANGKFGWAASKTLEVAQSLYESKNLTYPRTECRHLPEDMVGSFGKVLEALVGSGVPGAEAACERLAGGFKAGKRFVDSTKLTDHHAIIPTGVPLKIGLGDSDVGARLFGLVARRFVAMFLPERRQETQVVWLDIGGCRFRARGVKTLSPGWTEVLGAPEPEEGETEGGLPDVRQGASLGVTELAAQEKETKPPSRFTDATLLAAMKNAGRQLEGEARRHLAAAGGLGTPATRAETIETLVKRGYVRRNKKELRSTETGRAVIDVVDPQVKDVTLTAEWERELGLIEGVGASEAEQRARKFCGGLVGFLEGVIRGIEPGERKMMAAVQQVDLGSCPTCGRAMVEMPKSVSCSGLRGEPACSFVIWKNHIGKDLSVEVLASVLAGRKERVDGFRSSKGNVFSAEVRLDVGGRNNLAIEFVDAPVKGGKRQGSRSRKGSRRR